MVVQLPVVQSHEGSVARGSVIQEFSCTVVQSYGGSITRLFSHRGSVSCGSVTQWFRCTHTQQNIKSKKTQINLIQCFKLLSGKSNLAKRTDVESYIFILLLLLLLKRERSLLLNARQYKI